MAVLSIKSAGWLHGPGRTVWLGGAIRNFMAWAADGVANTFTVDNLTKITRMTRTDWQGTVALSASARTNLFTYAYSLDNAAWVKSGVTVAASAITVGPYTLWKVTESVLNEQHEIRQTKTLVSTVTYTQSAIMKAGELRYGYVRFGSMYTYADLLTGVITFTSVNAVGKIEDLGNGIYRVSITASGQTGAQYVAAGPTTTLNLGGVHLGDGTSGIYIGCQMFSIEGGGFIPTTTTPVTVTDYALASEEVTLGETPVAGAVFTLDGDITADVEGA